MWDQRYAEPGFAYGTEPNDFLREQAPRLAPASEVLCLAEGEGRNAVFLASLGHRVHGVDLSSVGLAKAQALAASRGVAITTELADLSRYDLGVGRWDAIVSIWAHMPPDARVSLHAGAVRGLRPGGLFVLEAYTLEQLRHGTGGPRDPALLMSAAQLRVELAGLEPLVAREVERTITEGPYHQGTSATVQYLARKPAGAG
jgi:SAM-dependent methyltransferase